jgi:predicted O-methyltransferase YrrM
MKEHNLLSISEADLFTLIKSPDNINATKKLEPILASDTIYGPQVMDLLNKSQPETRAIVHFIAKTLQPSSYLEVGVRRGWSTCALAMAAPECEIYAFDEWQVNYAHVPNPGPDFVTGEAAKFGYTKPINFVSGDSHYTLKQFFSQNPGKTIDMILIDGDHSEAGALMDLRDTMPHVTIGGAMLFDDIYDIPSLHDVWRGLASEFPNFRYFSFNENRPGVGIAIREK